MAIPSTPSPLSVILAAKTYNAAWFNGATKEAQITTAIKAAADDGALYVYVPASMLPYTAANVTFNTAVQMLGEGCSTYGYDVRAYGAAGDGVTIDTASFTAAVLISRVKRKPIYASSGTYKAAINFAATLDNYLKLHGDGPGTTTFIPVDSATAPITVAGSYNELKGFTVTNPAGTNNGSHWGIFLNGALVPRLREIFADGFNNNIHYIGLNDARFERIRSFAPVADASNVAVPTGCNIYASHPSAGTGFWVLSSSFLTGKYGVYTDAIEAPVFANCESLLQSHTGFYCDRTPAGASNGPFFFNTHSDSASVQAVFIRKSFASTSRGLWLSALGTGKGLVMEQCTEFDMHIVARNCPGQAVTVSVNSVKGTIGGSATLNPGGGVLINTGCHSIRVTGTFCDNGAPGVKFLDTTAGFPNQFDGIANGNTGGNYLPQSKDIGSGSNGGDVIGQTQCIPFARAAIPAGSASFTLYRDGIGTLISAVMPKAGSITALTAMSSPILASGAITLVVQINGVDTAFQLNLTSASQYSNSGALAPGTYTFAAGDRVGVRAVTIASGTIVDVAADMSIVLQ